MTTGWTENHPLLTGGDDLYLNVCRAGVPNDPLLMLNGASVEQFVADPKPKLRPLVTILVRDPELAEAQARRGWLSLTSGTDDEILALESLAQHFGAPLDAGHGGLLI